MRVFGIIICLVGSSFVLESQSGGIHIILFGGLLFIPKRKREVDLSRSSYRSGIVIGSWSLGKWRSFPSNINYISVIIEKRVSKVESTVVITAVSATNRYTEYVVNLIFNRRSKFRIGVGASFDDAIKIATQTSRVLKKDVYIVQPGNKYWIRYR